MVFNDDATLMSIFDVVDEESELKEAVLKYVQLGAVDDIKEQNEPTQEDIDFLNQVSSLSIDNFRLQAPLTALQI